MREDLKREYIKSPAYLFLTFLSTFHTSVILQLKKKKSAFTKGQDTFFFNYQFSSLPPVIEAIKLPPLIPMFSSDSCPAPVPQGLFWPSCSYHHQCMPLIYHSDIMVLTGNKNVQEYWQLEIPHCGDLWGGKHISFLKQTAKKLPKFRYTSFIYRAFFGGVEGVGGGETQLFA